MNALHERLSYDTETENFVTFFEVINKDKPKQIINSCMVKKSGRKKGTYKLQVPFLFFLLRKDA